MWLVAMTSDLCDLRIVVYGDDLFKAVVPDSAKSFNFQKVFKLTNEQVCCSLIHYFAVWKRLSLGFSFYTK